MIRSVMRSLALGIAILLSISPAAIAGEAADEPTPAARQFGDFSRAIRQLMDEQQLPSVVAAVAKDGRIIWEAAFGWADRERSIRATPDTPYSLASISKPFTATAVMKLVESGGIVLDRSANEFLGQARIAGQHAEKATVRHVLSHTAGLPPYFRQLLHGDPLPMDEIITRHALLSGRPGRRHVYSNLGYGILEHIIGRVSGVSYEEFMRREIFTPLRLDGASVPRTALPHVAARYDAHDRPLPFYDLAHRGASAVYASARDLVRFGMFHLKQPLDGSHPVLSARSIEEMQRIQTPESRADGYGLGWRIQEGRLGFRHVGHTGGMPGVTTVLGLYPADRVVVVVLTNKRSEAIVRLAQRIAARVMPRYRWSLAAR